MKKRIIAILCAAALVLALAGCQPQEDGTSTTTVTGKVTAVDGTSVTLQLGELTQGDMTELSGGVENGEAAPGIPSGGTDAAAPDMPSGGQAPGEGGGNPPEEPGGQGFESMNGTSPEDPNGPDGGGAGGTPPDMPNGNQGFGGGEGTPPEAPGGQGGGMMPGGSMSGFTAGEETVTIDVSNAAITVETMQGTAEGSTSDIAVDDILVAEVDKNNAAVTVVIKNLAGLGGQMGQPGGGFMDQPGGGQMGQPGGGFGGSGEVTQGTAANTIDTDGVYSQTSYTSTGDDENALRVSGATVTLDGITVQKTAGATSNTENGDFYGMNAALLATDGANVTITGSVVESSAQNGNGVFSYGAGTVVNISDSVITTTADNSGGIQTTGGGTTNASGLQVTTSGSSSAAIRSDRGGGTVSVDGGTYTSNGYNSPAVYSTADITVRNAVLTANNSEALVIEGKNSITLENCAVTGNMSDTHGTSSEINVHNVMIYQSMSGDADVGTSVFSMTGGSLTSNNGDMIYVTNTHCVLTLSGVEIVNRETGGHFLLVCGNDASRGWGTAGANGGQVEFTADGQTFAGDIAVDSISTLTMALTNGSVYTGAVNVFENAQNGTATGNNAVITIGSGSVWNLTGNCTVTSLENHGTINFNGYTITLADGTVISE